MAYQTLRTILPTAAMLLGLPPEDLGGILIEIIPSVVQNEQFLPEHLVGQIYSSRQPILNHLARQPIDYPDDNATRRKIELAIAEALNWLQTQGLIMAAPEQIGGTNWLTLTRRGRTLRSKADVEAYRKNKILPSELLQPVLHQKVVPQFQRGDYDVAVFQAAKEVEVSVRRAAVQFGKTYSSNLIGVALMWEAFNAENGPLRNPDLGIPKSELQAEANLFAGAMGHVRNPTAHRDVSLDAQEAARLIIFCSHLISIVNRRVEESGTR